MRYYKLLFTLIIILLTSNISSAAITEGDIYTFSINLTENYTIESLRDDAPGVSSERSIEFEKSLEITDIKDDELTYELLGSSWFYGTPEMVNVTISTNATEVGNSIFNIYGIYRTVNSGTEYLENVIILTGFKSFTNPDWKEFNQGVSDAIDEDRWVYVPSGTFGELLDESFSYELMGEKTVADAQNKLNTDKKLKYEFVFDFSGAVTYSLYDNKDNEMKYFDYSVFELSLTVEFDNNGVLSSTKQIRKTEVTTDSTIITTEEIYKTTKGGLSGFIAGVPGFELPIVILAIAIPAIIKKFRK